MTAATIDKRSEMTAREYAVSLGLAKMGRGRMSPLAKAAIGKAEKEGVTFKLPAHVIAQMEREANPKRVRKGKKPVNAETDAVDFRGNPNPPDPYDGTPNRPSQEWYDRMFAFGNFVCNPQGLTLRVTCEKMDAEGFTHFIDAHGAHKKARVYGSWGIRQGWPKGGISTNDA